MLLFSVFFLYSQIEASTKPTSTCYKKKIMTACPCHKKKSRELAGAMVNYAKTRTSRCNSKLEAKLVHHEGKTFHLMLLVATKMIPAKTEIRFDYCPGDTPWFTPR